MKIIVNSNEGKAFLNVFDSIKKGTVDLTKSVFNPSSVNVEEEYDGAIDDLIEMINIDFSIDNDSCTITMSDEKIVAFLTKYNKLLVLVFPKFIEIIKLYIAIGQDFIDVLS